MEHSGHSMNVSGHMLIILCLLPLVLNPLIIRFSPEFRHLQLHSFDISDLTDTHKIFIASSHLSQDNERIFQNVKL